MFSLLVGFGKVFALYRLIWGGCGLLIVFFFHGDVGVVVVFNAYFAVGTSTDYTGVSAVSTPAGCTKGTFFGGEGVASFKVRDVQYPDVFLHFFGDCDCDVVSLGWVCVIVNFCPFAFFFE